MSDEIDAKMFRSFIKCKSYNIVLIGDSRVGKSTFIKLLQEQFYTDSRELYRGTVMPIIDTLFYLDYQEICGSKNVCINILDTPGLDEVPAEGIARPNEQLKDIISEHIKQNFSSLDLILITIQNKGITENTVKSIYDIKDYFGNKYLNNIALLVTYCDDFTLQNEDAYLIELKQNPILEDFCNAIKDRIIFNGINKPKNTTVEDLEFLNEQKRRKLSLLNVLSATNRVNLKNENNLEDIRPIDILESAAYTNQIILSMFEENKRYKENMYETLDKLRKMRLPQEYKDMSTQLIENVGAYFNGYTLAESTIDEKDDAERYNDAEVPLKQKALQLRDDNYVLRVQLKQLNDSYGQLKLKELPEPPFLQQISRAFNPMSINQIRKSLIKTETPKPTNQTIAQNNNNNNNTSINNPNVNNDNDSL